MAYRFLALLEVERDLGCAQERLLAQALLDFELLRSVLLVRCTRLRRAGEGRRWARRKLGAGKSRPKSQPLSSQKPCEAY